MIRLFQKILHRFGLYSNEEPKIVLNRPDETVIAESDKQERRKVAMLIRYGWARHYTGHVQELCIKVSYWMLNRGSQELTVMELCAARRLFLQQLQSETEGTIGYHYTSAILNDLNREIHRREELGTDG